MFTEKEKKHFNGILRNKYHWTIKRTRIRINSICKNQKLSLKIKSIKFSVILRYQQITQACHKTVYSVKKLENTNFHLVDFIVPVNYTVMKKKEFGKMNKYLDLTRELKKLWHKKVTCVVIEAFEMVPKGLEKRLKELEIRGKYQDKTLLKWDRKLKGIVKIYRDLLSIRHRRKTTS